MYATTRAVARRPHRAQRAAAALAVEMQAPDAVEVVGEALRDRPGAVGAGVVGDGDPPRQRELVGEVGGERADRRVEVGAPRRTPARRSRPRARRRLRGGGAERSTGLGHGGHGPSEVHRACGVPGVRRERPVRRTLRGRGDPGSVIRGGPSAEQVRRLPDPPDVAADRDAGERRPQRLRPLLVQRLPGRRRVLLRHRRRAVPEPRHPRLRPEHRARRRAARVPRVAARPQEPTDLQIGPFAIDVLEPMRRIRVTIDENDTGIAADLTFTARTVCVEEGRQIRTHGRRPYGRHPLRQFGKWEGEIRYDGKTVRSTRRASTAPRTAAGASAASASPTPASRRRRRARARRSSSGRRCTGTTAARTSACSRTPTRTAGTPTRGAPGLLVTRRHPGAEDPTSSCSPTSSTRSTTSGHPPRRHARIALVHADGRVRTSTSSRSSASA